MGLLDVASIRNIVLSPDGRYMELETPKRTYHLFRQVGLYIWPLQPL